MSEKLCTLRTKGGGGGAKYTETSLWTNSAPTSTFAGQDVTLSDDINNYDCLKFTYRVTTSVADLLNYIISVSDFKKSLSGMSPHHCILGLSSNDSGAHTRRVYYKTDTSVTFDSSYQINVVATANTTCIPLSIIGIKNMGGIRTDEKYDVLPFQSVNGSAIPVFSTKGTAKAIWLSYAFTSSQYRALQITNVNPYTGEINNSDLYKIDTNAVGSYSKQANNAFVVTNGSVTLTNSLSSSALKMSLAYTY